MENVSIQPHDAGLQTKNPPQNVNAQAFKRYYKQQETPLDNLFKDMHPSESKFDFSSPDVDMMQNNLFILFYELNRDIKLSRQTKDSMFRMLEQANRVMGNATDSNSLSTATDEQEDYQFEHQPQFAANSVFSLPPT